LEFSNRFGVSFSQRTNACSVKNQPSTLPSSYIIASFTSSTIPAIIMGDAPPCVAASTDGLPWHQSQFIQQPPLESFPSRQPANPVTTNVPLNVDNSSVVEASSDCACNATSCTCDSAGPARKNAKLTKQAYLRRERFHGFRDVAHLPQRDSLANLDVNERILLKKRLLQHRLQEMIHRLQTERPEKITGALAAKIEYLKELATRP
jgi:hypothetical protein